MDTDDTDDRKLQADAVKAGKWQAWGTLLAAIVAVYSLIISINAFREQGEKDLTRYASKVAWWLDYRDDVPTVSIQNRSTAPFRQVQMAIVKLWSDDAPPEIGPIDDTDFTGWIQLHLLPPCQLVEIPLEGNGMDAGFLHSAVLQFWEGETVWEVNDWGRLRKVPYPEMNKGPGFSPPRRDVVSLERQRMRGNVREFSQVRDLPKKSLPIADCSGI